MIDPAEYRDRFPILASCTYLINHSLAAMPAAAEERPVVPCTAAAAPATDRT